MDFDAETLRLAEAVYLGMLSAYFTTWAIGACFRAASFSLLKGAAMRRAERTPKK